MIGLRLQTNYAIRMNFQQRHQEYLTRIEQVLEKILPVTTLPPTRLHEAMRYSVLGGGKRIRPLLVYATGEALGVETDYLDAPAAAIEMRHAFSLIHDDLPAMDDDELRRGKPTTHIAFDEATAILAADALQPLAFQILSESPALQAHPVEQIRIIRLLAKACGTNGMTGGQAMDMEAEGKMLEQASLEHMFRLKTGRLLRASVLAAAFCPPGVDTKTIHALERFIDALGLAFQRVGGDGDDARPLRPVDLVAADRRRQLEAVHVGHVAVGDQQRVRLGMPRCQPQFTIFRHPAGLT